MSEFRVIKCKKCDAALTELEGKKLTQCVQCGYQFGIETKQSSRQSSKQSRTGTTIGQLEARPELTTLVNKLRQLRAEKLSHQVLPKETLSHETGTVHQSRVKAKNKETPTIKSKKPVWVSLVKWYFIIVLGMGFLSQCGKYI